MTRTITPAPIRRSLTLRAPQARAFEVFTAGFGRWWPSSHSIGRAPMREAVIEQREGGRWYEIGQDGSECDWGRVLAWEPPSRLLLAWQVNSQFQSDPAVLSEVELRFHAEGEGLTRVEFEHRHLERLGPDHEAIRARIDSPRGWTGLLQRFAEAAETSEEEIQA